MQIQDSINRVSPMLARSESSRFSQSRETFHDILQRTMNNKSGPRPPKIELTGVLVPCNKVVHERQLKFKLDTDSGEYFLSMSDDFSLVAKKIQWEDVTVKGMLNPEGRLFEVEKISLARPSELFKPNNGPLEPFFEIDHYKRIIAQRGKLDLSPDYVAS